MEFRALRPKELDHWFDFVAHTLDQPRQVFVDRWKAEPHRDITGVRIALVNEQIVGTLQVVPREVYLAGRVVPTGGLACVCTDEAHRGRGVAGALLLDGVRFMASRGMALSILCSRRQDLFVRFGWKPAPTHWVVSQASTNAPGTSSTEGGSPFEVVAAHPRDPSEARQMQGLYEPFARSFQGAVSRSNPAYWSGWIPRRWQRGLTARRNGRIIGYLGAKWTGDDQVTVVDFAAEPREAPVLFQAFCGALARERSLPAVRVRYPRALQVGLPVAGSEATDGLMYRVTSPHALPLEAAQALDRIMRGESEQHLIYQADLY